MKCPTCKKDYHPQEGPECHQCADAKEKANDPSDATACSLIVGYRLENGTDKAEIYFLPNRPAQKTLDQMADLISDGWMVSRIIYSENAESIHHH
jgi:hypothetical protein